MTFWFARDVWQSALTRRRHLARPSLHAEARRRRSAPIRSGPSWRQSCSARKAVCLPHARATRS